jgi:hypothetical protein
LAIVSVALDSAGKILKDQPLAGGSQLEVQIANSNPDVAKLRESKLIVAGGWNTATTAFLPGDEGETTIAPVQPAGFSTPAERASVTLAVATPGLAIAGDLFASAVILGAPAPPGGLNVTLKSADPSRMVLSSKELELGSGSITLMVPAGERTIPYFIQAFGDSGEVEYSATAPGYKSRSAKISLTRSGVILAYQGYGPPEEGNVKRKIGTHKDSEFFVSMAETKGQPVHLLLFSAYIDRETGRSADFTVEPLRAGVSATVGLTSSNPEVATIGSPLTIRPGSSYAVCVFTPVSPGKTTISIDTPDGFSTPQNAIAVHATVAK